MTTPKTMTNNGQNFVKKAHLSLPGIDTGIYILRMTHSLFNIKTYVKSRKGNMYLFKISKRLQNVNT